MNNFLLFFRKLFELLNLNYHMYHVFYLLSHVLTQRYLLLRPKLAIIPKIPREVSSITRGVPSTVVPALITLLFLASLGWAVVTPLDPLEVFTVSPPEERVCSSASQMQPQVLRKRSSKPVDSSHPLTLDLLEIVFLPVGAPPNMSNKFTVKTSITFYLSACNAIF